MTRPVFLVMSESTPDDRSEVVTRVVALLSDPDEADAFRDRYQQRCGRSETVYVDDRRVDDPDDYLELA